MTLPAVESYAAGNNLGSLNRSPRTIMTHKLFFARRFALWFCHAKHAFSTWFGPGNTALLGPEVRPETGPDVMETVANSPSDRRQVGRQKDPQRLALRERADARTSSSAHLGSQARAARGW